MKVPEIDEEEINNMILSEKERNLKTRIWNNLNKEWLTEQNEKKRKKKEQAKKVKSQIMATSSIAQSMISEGDGLPIEDSQNNLQMNNMLDNESQLDSSESIVQSNQQEKKATKKRKREYEPEATVQDTIIKRFAMDSEFIKSIFKS